MARKWGFWRDLAAVPTRVNKDKLSETAGDASWRTDFRLLLRVFDLDLEQTPLDAYGLARDGFDRRIDESRVVG